MLMFAQFGTVTFTGVFGAVHGASQGVVTALGLLLLLGACGKSAQLPLQSWLLDAMEGPTPVSALIHAATMVTAGVYLIVRSNPIFNLTADARLAVTIVGAVTLLFGAIIGCAKDDIKKSLAGSTMSQIGYMLLAAGLGPAGYVFAIAQLLAHGFFKAGLFLGRRVGQARDERRGGHAPLRRHRRGDAAHLRRVHLLLPRDHRSPAVLGVLHQGPDHRRRPSARAGTSGALLGTAALIGAGLTTFYMTRMLLMTFTGDRRWDEGQHPHEAPPVMTGPAILLAIGALAAGAFLMLGSRLIDFLAPVIGRPPSSPGLWTPAGIGALALLVAAVILAWFMYGRREVPVTAPSGSPVTVAARKELYGNAFNESLLMRPGQWLTRLSVYFDNRGIDGLVNTLAATMGGTSGRVRRVENGFVRSYALLMFLGAALLVGALLLVRL